MDKKAIVFIFILGLFIHLPFKKVEAAFDCLTLTTASSQADKDYCKIELGNIEAELADLLNKQKEQQKNTGTLTGDVKYLNAQINALKTKVKARALVIAQLKVSIKEKNSKIENLSDKIENQYESLGQLIRNTNDFDNENLVHLLLSGENLSGFYGDLESYSSLKEAIKRSVDEIKGVKSETEEEKKDLEKKQDAETDAKIELELSQKKVAQTEAEKKKLLSISKNKEAEYQKLAATKKAQADKIRAALFTLRDTKAIPFGTAVSYAEKAEKATGVHPALTLAILRQETNLGANVGTCNRSTDPTSKSWENIMKSPRDTEPYKRIMADLGLPLAGTPLSCPQGSGYGGAMGPSQFIPSTWELFASKIAKAVGISGMPNPWDPFHAITATSTYMGELGANAGTYTAERNAACKYYSGSSCPKNPKSKREKEIVSYGNNVMALREKMQADIDLLSN
jgi:peptidoglycan hydrolase CwlO-like protein